MFRNPIPWRLRGLTPFLNTYGDKLSFGAISKTRPIETNPQAKTTIHSAVPHRYVYAYLIAIKSLLQYDGNYAICIHDDGSLTSDDKKLISNHLPYARIIDRQFANSEFERLINNHFLSKVRGSYTSYLKLFDTTLLNNSERIIILDTDTLFLRSPEEIIQWSHHGGQPWYHMAPDSKMKTQKEFVIAEYSKLQKIHIQALIIDYLDEINVTLNSNYQIKQGFCSGFIGYDHGTINFNELEKLFKLLHKKFGEKIFLWGAEQTVHGLLLCSKGAKALPIDDYFVFTHLNSHMVNNATFVHFVGENRFYKLIYPNLAKAVITRLKRE
jgi:lipopolysaccharide biosynthesis glycosyltransferase